MATDDQLEVLARMREWYVDGTFDLVRMPFYHLYSVHAFIRNGDGMRAAVPIVHILMSGKTKQNYVTVSILEV